MAMIQVSDGNDRNEGYGVGVGVVGTTKPNNKYERLRRKSLAFLTSLFKLRKRNNCLTTGMRIDEEDIQTITTMQRHSPKLDNPAGDGCAITSNSCKSRLNYPYQQQQQQPQQQQQQYDNGNNNSNNEDAHNVSRIPSSLSVTAVDVAVACRQARITSPSHSSVLTLTPGRTRNIDQDMEALRLSRQDNPYLQVLASKESLIEPVEESESDDAILMSQEFGDTDPLTLAQVHEHLVRSPPPASWSRTPIFHFPHQPQDSPSSKSESGHYRTSSPKWMLHRDEQPKSEGSMDPRDRHLHAFSRLNPTPIRSLSEVRRLHRSAEDSVQLMSSE